MKSQNKNEFVTTKNVRKTNEENEFKIDWKQNDVESITETISANRNALIAKNRSENTPKMYHRQATGA